MSCPGIARLPKNHYNYEKYYIYFMYYDWPGSFCLWADYGHYLLDR